MKPSSISRRAAAVTLSKGKMVEFGVPPEEHHLNIPESLDLNLQFPLALGTIGDFAVEQIEEAQGNRKRFTPLEEVLFAAQVLIAIVDAKIAEPIEGLVKLVAAAAFLLADSPGRSAAHCKSITSYSLAEGGAFAEALLTSLLEPWKRPVWQEEPVEQLRKLLQALRAHYSGRMDAAEVVESAATLRNWVYANGNANELLFADLVCAVAIRRAKLSARTCLPKFTGIDESAWDDYLSRADAIRDMWPSQQMLGKSEVYAGKSAVVQMPTSAGKTRAIELIVRSAFMSERTSLAIIVAPFRALCYEIAQDLRSKLRADGVQVNQLSDALQPDYRLDLSAFLELGLETADHVVVLTPEKLLYVARQEPDFLSNAGLVIYDEGHQFDDSGRGVTYELLLTSLKRNLPANAQTVLISAVISNATQLAGWLLADSSNVVHDTSIQTSRHIAFTTLERGAGGQLQFDSIIDGEQEFFVPRLISQYKLSGKKKPQVFPTKESGSIALYLGCKLVPQGGVAIFVGKPESATKIIREAVEDIFSRSTDIQTPAKFANEKELKALVRLYKDHFGSRSSLTRGAEHGLFAHTGNTPQGIRLAIEHAMRHSLIPLIVCTTTLAQGVNLPIRYILVTTPHQNGALLKIREFQNLIGRAGRAGIYGDGTIIFTDATVYDSTRTKMHRKWEEIKSLLKPELSAPTTSALLRLVRPLRNIFGDRTLDLRVEEVIEALIVGEENIYYLATNLAISAGARRHFRVEDVARQLDEKAETIASIESFLMAHQSAFDEGMPKSEVRLIAEETFAYYLGTESERSLLIWAFERIWSEIAGTKLQAEVLTRYGRTLLGLRMSKQIDAWVQDNLFEIQLSESPEELLEVVWPFLESAPTAERLRKLEPVSARKSLATDWIKGKSFEKILQAVEAEDGYIRWGTKRRKVTLESIVGYCQNDLAFEACLLLSAVAASFDALSQPPMDDVAGHFDKLGKLLKYGLRTEECAALYEAGFSDRVLSQRLAKLVPPKTLGQHAVKAQLRKMGGEADEILSAYPDYFKTVLTSLVR